MSINGNLHLRFSITFEGLLLGFYILARKNQKMNIPNRQLLVFKNTSGYFTNEWTLRNLWEIFEGNGVVGCSSVYSLDFEYGPL